MDEEEKLAGADPALDPERFDIARVVQGFRAQMLAFDLRLDQPAACRRFRRDDR